MEAPRPVLYHADLLVQLQRQAVRVVEEGEAALAVGVQADGLAFDSLSLQLLHGLFHVIHPESQVAQAQSLRLIGPGGGVGDSEDLQFAVAESQIQLPVPLSGRKFSRRTGKPSFST